MKETVETLHQKTQHQTIADLRAENILLKTSNAYLNQSRGHLIEQNHRLAEFIRKMLNDTLLLAKAARDEYQHYTEFVTQLKVSEDRVTKGQPDDENKEEGSDPA